MRKLKTLEIERLSPEEFRKKEKTPVVAVLDDVRSLHNVGSVFRTADAFLLEGIHLCGITATPPQQEIHKTALGAENTVAWEYHKTAVEAVKALKQRGFRIFSVEQCEGSLMLQDLGKELLPTDEKGTVQHYALVLGNEVKGVSDEVIALSDKAIEIPQGGTKHSLNVSVAAGIVLWEMYRRLSIR